MEKIIIYVTKGICRYSARNMKTMLEKIFYTKAILTDDLSKLNNSNILCVPGGIGSKFLDKIKKKNLEINNFIDEGGTYLGICCGAYIASKNIVFEYKNTPGLNLLDIDSIGPIYKDPMESQFDINNINNVKIVDIKDVYNNKNYNAYLHGGGYFDISRMYEINNKFDRYNYKINKNNLDKKHIIIEAEYQNKTPSIISFKKGKGNVILSHVHPEHEYSNLDNTFQRIFKSYNIDHLIN